MITETDRDALRDLMPELLNVRCGITDLRRSFRCPSPNHDDRDPSAHYYANDNTVHCFGCGKTWDVFSLIGELDGVDGFAEQARAVADAVGYRLSDDDEPRRPKPKPRRKPRPLFDAPREAGGADCAEACGNAFGQLYYAENDIGRRYLRWRGLDDGDAATFGLGFTKDPKEIMPEFSVYEPKAFGFITIPFWNRDFSTANYCMVRTVCKPGDARNKEWRPRGLATPLWCEWLLSAAAEQVYVTEGLIDAMALAKITGGDTMALGGVSNAKRLAQVLYATPPELRPKKITVAMDEDDEGRRTRDRICHDLDVLRVPHAVMPPYPGGTKDADEYLMALRGKSCSLEEIAAELFCRCKAGDFGMVIIDPAYMVQDGDENNAKDIRELFAKLDEICVNLECTVVISHHHSKGAQGLKSAIDRGSGSGVFGRAPDAVLDMTELILEPGTLEMARQSHKLAEVKRLTGWRMSFTLREFAQKDPLDLWLVFPLHEVDHTDLLADFKPNYGGVSEARKLRTEAENLGKVASLEGVCDRLIGHGESCERDELRKSLGWSLPTVRRWLEESNRFEQTLDPKTGKALIVRVAVNDAATSGSSGDAADSGEEAQGVLPIA